MPAGAPKPRPPLPGGPYLIVGLARSGVAAAVALRARGEEDGKFLPHPKRADWKSAAEPFSHRDCVRQKIGILIFQNALPAVKFASAKLPGLHFVEQKEQVVFIAKPSQTEQIFAGCYCDSALTLNGFDQNRSG